MESSDGSGDAPNISFVNYRWFSPEIKSLHQTQFTRAKTVQTLPVEHLHDICREAIEQCKQMVKPLGQRFLNLKSETPLKRKEEIKWLMESLDHWFTKKWNDVRRAADMRKNDTSPKKKKTFCMQCQKISSTSDRSGVELQVFLSLLNSSNSA